MLTLHPPQPEFIPKLRLLPLRHGCGLQEPITTGTGSLRTGLFAGLNRASCGLIRVAMFDTRQRSLSRCISVSVDHAVIVKIILDKAPYIRYNRMNRGPSCLQNGQNIRTAAIFNAIINMRAELGATWS